MPPSKRAKTTPTQATPRAHGDREAVERPPIIPLDLAWVNSVRINSSSVKRTAAELPLRRTVKKDWQAAWLLRAVTSACSSPTLPLIPPFRPPRWSSSLVVIPLVQKKPTPQNHRERRRQKSPLPSLSLSLHDSPLRLVPPYPPPPRADPAVASPAPPPPSSRRGHPPSPRVPGRH
jgi:hypothetical protein